MLTVSQMQELFRQKDFRPLKRLGENYLIDANIKDKIIRSSRLSKDDVVIEIGPGFGALTFDLAKGAAQVFAVEKDRKAFSILKEIAGNGYPNLALIRGDILQSDVKALSGGSKVKIIGNLPYYITTPIIEMLVRERDIIKSAVVVIQREVAERITAAAGDRNYGSISCFARYHFDVEKLFTIKSSSFFPRPEVDSAAVMFTARAAAAVKVRDEDLMFRLIRGSFNQRRKTIMNSLSRAAVTGMSKDSLKAALEKSGVDPSSRPEELSLEQFAAISDALTGTTLPP